MERCHSLAPERDAGLWLAFVLQNQSGRKYESSLALFMVLSPRDIEPMIRSGGGTVRPSYREMT
jgi:hypothetical protein